MAIAERSAVDVVGWGCARVPSEKIVDLRRALPSWAPTSIPGHFFKYADEQTLVAAQAVDDVLQRFHLNPSELANWGIIAAPQFLGRQVTAHAFDQFYRAGGSRVSPHIVPQNSLHSVSGALSILLATHGPNVGIGGSRAAIEEGLLATLTWFDVQASSGCWLVATAWDPEPLPDRRGLSSTPGVCHAVALAVRSSASGESCGRLTLSDSLRVFSADASAPVTVAELVSRLQTLDGSPSFSWQLPWGPILSLEVSAPAALARRAA
jgi:hypothetical protein